MRVAGSSRFFLNPKEKETLARMAKDGTPVEDMEEGEISDSASVEEISEEDFKQDSKPKGGSRVWMTDLFNYPVSSSYSSGLYNLAWAQAVQNKPLDEILVRDCRSDEKPKSSSSNLLVNSTEDNNKSLNPSKEVCEVIIDVSSEEIDNTMEDGIGSEKEEGELEEGEIELDSEIVQKPEVGMPNDNSQISDSEKDSKELEMDFEEREFEKKLNSIRETLETVTRKDAEKSFHGVCSQLQTSLESLQLLALDSRVPVMDAVIRQSFTGIQAVNSTFCSMNRNQQEQNKDFISRLLSHVKSQNPVLFSHEQMKEIEAMMQFLDSQAVLSSTEAIDKEKDVRINDGVNMNDTNFLARNTGHGLNHLKKVQLEPLSVKSLDQIDPNMDFEVSIPGLSFGSKGRLGFGPLLDLHRDHDADSLPSPTRETPPALLVLKSEDAGDGAARLDLETTRVAHKTEDTTMHPYETDALKAVSTYQQKFGRTSFILSNRLPSPTPSEECDDGDGDIINGEVSSSFTVVNNRTLNPPVTPQPIICASPSLDVSSGQGLVPARNVGHMGSGPNPIVRALAKTRDTRLRYANADVGSLDLTQNHLSVEYNSAPKNEPLGGLISSKKHKIVEVSVLDGHTLKRQKDGATNSGVVKDGQLMSVSGGWSEDSSMIGPHFTERNQLVENRGTDPRKLENIGIGSGKRQDTGSGNLNATISGNQQLPLKGTGTTVSLPSLWKNIAVNPTMLMHLINMEQQRIAAETQQSSCDPAQNTMQTSSSNALPRRVPLGNVASSKTSELEQKPAGKNHVPAQAAPTNTQGEWGKIHMKPRDPRRILHNNTFQKSDCYGSEPFKANGAHPSSIPGSKDNLTVRQQGEQAETNTLASQSALPPDIARQFTKKLKNLANILSASQATKTPTVVAQVVSSQPIPIMMDKAEVKAVATDSDDQRNGTALTPEGGTADFSKSQNTWGDVEHLFEGYDDQQKAAIQRERARRIEEQSKMFAARKLCLVLDLDHTLLNSAKFVEVEPQHDEMLRKKEEQDREKPLRHLFHFLHMGMWTKLRPGIWNFLEKASKLYELHLYTMGNKLYATEMAKVLDPTGALFAGRVISKGDDGDPFDGDEKLPKSKDLDGVLGMESAVVIIDDSVRVWPHNKLNLIVVERYTFFPCSRRQFGLMGPSLLELDIDERPEDGTLASSLSVIERIHQIFFSHRSLPDVDVRNILASEQQKILAGCRIVFSRVFPVGEANPHLHPQWQTAEQFGAVCTNQIDEQVTHVVANCLGTDKVNWALSTGRFVVQPGWVEASALLYRRANEHEFVVKP
ncbi:hypothetical protein HHK36_015920 [Tetracentron sinense]|uniref:protein-serine/threonine phosphatase n=1 Tax=Tetracentron sinense TaxID=13715 RepID=A0A834Z5Y0_TETSI|nr:hypothetical protein HHK36_015920 [Tetracentron sinense]